MPAALHRGGKTDLVEVSTPTMTLRTTTHIKQFLLCAECEELFDQGGETHVLKVVAAKNKKSFPLHDRMRVACARQHDPSISGFYGPDFELDMDKFAYFALSVIWRLGAARWEMQDGTLTREVNLGEFQARMRRFLLGEIPFPSDMAVIVIVCSDLESRKWVFHPAGFVEGGCLNFRFLARGLFFRVMFGYRMSSFLREQSCTSPRKWIMYADCEKRTLEAVSRGEQQ
jgi:hypothetical protein